MALKHLYLQAIRLTSYDNDMQACVQVCWEQCATRRQSQQAAGSGRAWPAAQCFHRHLVCHHFKGPFPPCLCLNVPSALQVPDTTLPYTVLHSIALHCTLCCLTLDSIYYTKIYCTRACYFGISSTAIHYSAQHSTAQHSSAQPSPRVQCRRCIS